MENKTVLVGNVAAGMETGDLDVLFSTVGDVKKITLHTDSESGRTRCLVEMATSVEASDCVDRFHGQQLNGRVLSVSMNVVRSFAPLAGLNQKRGAQVADSISDNELSNPVPRN